jgi:hypothetical protein
MTSIVLMLVLAVTVEALVQYTKTIMDMVTAKDYKTAVTQLEALLADVALCVLAGADVYGAMGVSFGGAVCLYRRVRQPGRTTRRTSLKPSKWPRRVSQKTDEVKNKFKRAGIDEFVSTGLYRVIRIKKFLFMPPCQSCVTGYTIA